MKTQLTVALTAATLATLASLASGHAAQAQGPVFPGTPTKTTYRVEVRTGCVAGAGTDANIYIIMRKRTGTGYLTTSGIVLDNPGDNDFERGRTDTFNVVANKLDRIDTIFIGHDNAGSAPGWLIRDIRIYNYSNSTWTTFPVQRWLAADECDRQLSLWLNAGIRPYCTPDYYGGGSGC